MGKQGRAMFITSWVIWCLGVKWEKPDNLSVRFLGWELAEPKLAAFHHGVSVRLVYLRKNTAVSTAYCLSGSGARDSLRVQGGGKLPTHCERSLHADSSSVPRRQATGDGMVWTQVTDSVRLTLESDDHHPYMFCKQSPASRIYEWH